MQQTSPCVSALAPDYTKITDINVRKALAYAYPYQDVWIAAGEVPGVTRVPANSLMPPGMAGKKDFQVDGEQITYDPVKSKELLAEAGYRDKPYPITMVFYEVDPWTVAAQDQITKGFEEGGFSVKAIPVQGSPYNIWLDPDNKINKPLNVRGINLCADWPAGSTMLPPLLSRSGAYNTAYFDEPSVDEEMDDIATLPLEEQADAWGALDEKIMTEYFPIIPTAFRNELFVFGTKIGNPTGDGSIGCAELQGPLRQSSDPVLTCGIDAPTSARHDHPGDEETSYDLEDQADHRGLDPTLRPSGILTDVDGLFEIPARAPAPDPRPEPCPGAGSLGRQHARLRARWPSACGRARSTSSSVSSSCAPPARPCAG